MSALTPEHPGVYRFLDCSTAHISEEDADALTRGFDDDDDMTPRVIKHEYGWWLNVRERDEETERWLAAHPNFEPPYEYARQHGCWWINFDQDGATIAGLPTWEW